MAARSEEVSVCEVVGSSLEERECVVSWLLGGDVEHDGEKRTLGNNSCYLDRGEGRTFCRSSKL